MLVTLVALLTAVAQAAPSGTSSGPLAQPTLPILPTPPVNTTLPRSQIPDPEEQIPTHPKAPPPLTVKAPVDSFRCERSYTYKGKTLTCDSYVRHDAEGLRPVLTSVPEAVSELNIYQSNRSSIRNSAFVVTGGLLFAFAGTLIGPRIGGVQGIAVRNLMGLTGVAVGAGSFIYTVSLLRTNESHLGTAVLLYNGHHPESPVELQFSTGIAF